MKPKSIIANLKSKRSVAKAKPSVAEAEAKTQIMETKTTHYYESQRMRPDPNILLHFYAH